MAKKGPRRAGQKAVVYAIARKHRVPGWLLWGIYGAESTWGTNGTNYFGLIEPTYRMYNGKTRSPKNTADLVESADIAAELLYSLKKETGSWAGAVSRYAPYDISHPRELSRQGGAYQNKTVGFDPGATLPEILGSPGKLFDFPEIPGGPGPTLPQILSSPADTIGDISNFFKLASKLLFTPEGWLQIGEVTGGIILIGWGTHRLINASTGVNPTRTVTHTAAKAAEVAAVIK
jgi:hypothetical protein